MKKTLGLDIGTNSIGWALIENDWNEKQGNIIGIGSRIIPMDGDTMNKFETGNPVSKTADRRTARSARRLLQRYRLRKSRLIRVFKLLGWFPADFPEDFRQLEKFNINDYAPFSDATISEAKKLFEGENISTDWVIYYLRAKALEKQITLTELARILYHLNQRRGFKSSRKDIVKEEVAEKRIWIEKLCFDKIEPIINENKKDKQKYVVSAGQYSWEVERKKKPEWEGQTRYLKITETILKDGTKKQSFTVPEEDDYLLMIDALKKNIEESGLTVGSYFLNQIINDRNFRIKQKIIDRKLFINELDAIWNKQYEFYPELQKHPKIELIANELYKHNEAKQKELKANSLLHLFKNDIIYYQRDLKSQKHLISNCRYEKKKDSNGNEHGIKVAPKSSPVFQEFRIWQDISSLKVFKLEERGTDGKIRLNIEETNTLLDFEAKAKLFKLFDSRTNISVKAILKELNINEKTHKLNYPDEKEFKGNETKADIRKVFRKHDYIEQGEKLLANKESFQLLWHILYSLNDKNAEKGIFNAMKSNFDLSDELAMHFSKISEFPNQYASLSAKAINKLLPLMRCGEFWNDKAIHVETKKRIEKVITGEDDTNIDNRTREQLSKLQNLNQYQGLPVWLASYVVYGRHSERENENKYADEIGFEQIKALKQGELRNPIVEQVTNETLALVKEVWKQYGRPDEIHIELARELKKNADERKKIADVNIKNANDRARIVAILKELQGANPDSMSDADKLKIWEETGNAEARVTFTEIFKKLKDPTKAEIEKYKLWGEQNHISPYTGKIIPLSKLFTKEYQIEHIIPRSRFFDDSFTNKTICESEVNDLKDNRTGMQFIEECGGMKVQLSNGKEVEIFKHDAYLYHVRGNFFGKKRRNFLCEEIPDDFIQRQINDTRYIGKKLGELLYPVAKDDNGVIFTLGSITSNLKEKWGLHRVWKELLKPRFERLEKITGEQLIDFDNERNDIHFKKDYKRIDHRHHALDALLIACTSLSHIQYLNTLNAQNTGKIDKQKFVYLYKSKARDFVLPWNTFTKEAREALSQIIISHKNTTKAVTKGFNLFTKYIKDENGKWIKKVLKQETQSNGEFKLLSVRKSMFKEPLGIVNLREYRAVSIKEALATQLKFIQDFQSKTQSRIANKELREKVNTILKNSEFDLVKTETFLKKNTLKDVEGNEIKRIQIIEFKQYAAKRVSLDDSFSHEKINKIPYAEHSWLAKALHTHLKSKNDQTKEAFTGEGLEELAKKVGKPIYKVTIYEEIGNKTEFKGKLVEADKGTNLYFAIYENLNDPTERIINAESSIPLMNIIERKANNLPIADEKERYKTILLSPNDLVYVPEPEENIRLIDWKNEKQKISERIYKVVSFSKSQIFFIPHFVSSPLIQAEELGANNKSETSWDGQMIKKIFIKIKLDRLGNIIEADGKKLS
jgi:CRISPR-associated endonuclease Csn1